MPRVAGLAVLTALLLVIPSVSHAQIGGGGSIQGTVLDTSGAPVPGRRSLPPTWQLVSRRSGRRPTRACSR